MANWDDMTLTMGCIPVSPSPKKASLPTGTPRNRANWLPTPQGKGYIQAMRRSIRSALLCLLAILAVGGRAWGGRIQLDPPGPRQFILDEVGVLDPAVKTQIQQECDKLLTDRATPIVVVVISFMGSYGEPNLPIETFARLLFDQWQVGIAKLGREDWNTGILLVVSVGDRKARIELGAGWGHGKDPVCQQIMQEHIIPRFKQGDYAGGIMAGVKALDAMARGKPLPVVPRPWWHTPLVLGFIGLLIFTVVSLVRRGSGGWAWLFWGVVFSVIGYLLYAMMTRSSSSDGGFSGGSFGGGFSGGGGASGSW
jgi:uncharacterized protein